MTMSTSPKRSPAAELIGLFFRDVMAMPGGVNPGGGLVYICSLPNVRNDPLEPIGERNVCPTTVTALDGFVRKWDRARRATYFCVGTTAGQKRNKNNICRTVCLHADIDFKAVIEDEPTIRARITTLRCPPTVVVFSGHGLHLYWLFREPLETQEMRDRIEEALRHLAEALGSDPTVAEIARLMRLPGSHNTKYGAWHEVRIETLDGPRYELSDLEEWLSETTANARPPLLTRKQVESVKTLFDDGETDSVDRPAVDKADIAARIAAMTYQGAGETGIHATHLHVTSKLAKAGMSFVDIVAMLFEPTKRAAGAEGLKWNWKDEERDLYKMCASGLEKYPSEEAILQKIAPVDTSSNTANTTDGATDTPDEDSDNVLKFGGGGGRGGGGGGPMKPKSGGGTVDHIYLGEMFLNGLRAAGEALMFVEQGAYRYRGGAWHLEDDKILTAWLNSRLEVCVQSTTARSSERLIREARNWIIRQPELQKHHQIKFDVHGCVPTLSGLIDPRTSKVTPVRPEHYCTWQIPYDYKPGATCPYWLQMLDDVFADRSPESRALHIQLVQELLGAGLIDVRPKALSRALIFVGGSDYGKSGLIDVLSALFSQKRNTTPLDALEKNQHATVAFLQRIPWVLHEAFDAGRWVLSSTVKAIISSDPININIKNGRQFGYHVSIPIFWGSNTAPQFREATAAVVNRIVVIDCKRKFNQDKPVGAAIVARERGFKNPSDLVIATEMEGVLVWAVEGLKRALARGHLVLPRETIEAAEAVRLNSNLVAEFLQDCLEFDPNAMVSTADFAAAVTSWWFEHKGEERGAPSSERIGVALRALGEPRVATDRKELRRSSGRFYAGIKLNGEGKRHWTNTVTSTAFTLQSRTVSTSEAGADPNQVVPPSWDNKECIIAMRLAHSSSGHETEDGPSTAARGHMTGHTGENGGQVVDIGSGHQDQELDVSGEPEF